MTVLRILFAAIFVWFFCVAAGQLLFRAIGLTLRKTESLFLGFLTGASLVSTMMFALASGRLVYTKIVVAAGLATIGVWWLRCRPDLQRDPDEEALPPIWRLAFWIPLAVYGCLYVYSSLAPETSADGTVYHLGLITRYYDHRGFMQVPNDMFAGLPEGIEMLFWIGYSLGKHSAAAMVHTLFLLAMPFGMLAFAMRVKMAKAGVVAALLFCLAPAVAKDGTIAYVDVGTAAVVFGTVYCLWLWRNTGCRAALIPAGLLAGFCYACKMTAAMAIPFAVLYVVWTEIGRRQGWRAVLRPSIVTALLACTIAVPWMVKNAVMFHNPFFPIMNHWFPNPYLYPMTEDSLRKVFVHLNGVPYRDFPWELTVGGKLLGVVGPAFWLAPVALLSLRFPAGRLCLLAFLIFMPPFFGNTDVRFLFPALPFLAMAIGIGLLSIPWAGAGAGLALVALHSYSVWPGIIQSFVPSYQWRIDLYEPQAVFRMISEREWFATHWHEYAAGEMLDRYVQPGELVFSPNMGQIAYHHRNLVGSFDSTLAVQTFNLFLTPFIDIWANGWHREIRFAPVTTRRIRVQAGSDMDNELRIHEMRFFDGDREIPRKPDWRLTASRNPWEVGMAFDGDGVSWWTSGQRVDPQTWIEADFPADVRLDRVVIDQNEDQRWMQLAVLADVNGKMALMAGQETAAMVPKRADIRMAVRDSMKASGIRWILIQEGAYGAEDLRSKAAYWGVTEVAEGYGYRLWKLN